MNAQALLAAIVCLSYYGNQGGRLFFGLQDFLGVGTLLNDPDTEFPQDENDSQSWCPSDATGRMIHSGGSRSWICHHLPPGAAHLPRWGKHPCLCELHPFLPPKIKRKLKNNVDNNVAPPLSQLAMDNVIFLSPIFTYPTILQSLLPCEDVNIPRCRLLISFSLCLPTDLPYSISNLLTRIQSALNQILIIIYYIYHEVWW